MRMSCNISGVSTRRTITALIFAGVKSVWIYSSVLPRPTGDIFICASEPGNGFIRARFKSTTIGCIPQKYQFGVFGQLDVQDPVCNGGTSIPVKVLVNEALYALQGVVDTVFCQALPKRCTCHSERITQYRGIKPYIVWLFGCVGRDSKVN